MASTTFINGTVVQADWLNDVNSAVYNATSGISNTNTKTLVSTVAGLQVYLSWFTGADPTGATDSTTALINAEAFLTSKGGGNLIIDGAYYLNNSHTIPDDISYVGLVQNPGQRFDGTYLPTNYRSSLILGTGLVHGNRNSISNMLIIQKNLSPLGTYPMPFANATVATNAVAAFTGSAVSTSTYTADFRMEDVLVLGFAYVYNGLAATGNNRPLFRRVYGDCTNGIHVSNVFDIGRAEDCHMWEFTTTNQSFTTNNLITRTGTAFLTTGNSTWFRWDDCFAYGWACAHDVNGCQDVRHIECGADGPVGASQLQLGFRYRGSIGNSMNIGCTGTAQSDCAMLINADPQNGVNHTSVVGFTAHGNNSANGYIHIVQGSASITDSIFIDNSAVGHINLESAVTTVIVSNNSFSNLGGGTAVIGNTAAVGRVIWGTNNYPGSTIQALPTWTPAIAFGGSTTGITYTTQLGSFQFNGRIVQASFKIVLLNKGAAVGAATIGGLPLTVNGTGGSHGGGAINYALNMAGLTGSMVASGIEGTTTVSLYQSAAGGITTVTDANFNNNSTIYGTVTYSF